LAVAIELQKGSQREISAPRIDAGGIVGDPRTVGVQKFTGKVQLAELQVNLVKILMCHHQVKRPEKAVFLEIDFFERY
jgi:hypothetical protein